VAFIVAILIGLVYGGADQYLGSLTVLVHVGRWPSTVSQMSALWLILPFLLGCSQTRPRRAALLGLIVTQAALAGYFAMTVSPLEGVPLARVPTSAAALVASNAAYVLGGLATGPLYGLLGQRWRVSRWWVSGVMVAATLCLEPSVRAAVGHLLPPSSVWRAELVAGVVVGVTLALSARGHRRGRPVA
jgi:hypothetical protein